MWQKPIIDVYKRQGKRQTIRQREKQMEETIARYQTEMEELQK